MRGLEERHDESVALSDERRYSIWRLYLSDAARSFAQGGIQLIQALLSKPGPNSACELPPTRADVYA